MVGFITYLWTYVDRYGKRTITTSEALYRKDNPGVWLGLGVGLGLRFGLRLTQTRPLALTLTLYTPPCALQYHASPVVVVRSDNII